MAELSIKNLRLRLRRHYTHTRKKAWLSIMPSLVAAYNAAPKRSLGGLSPAQAINLTNEHLQRLRGRPTPGAHAKPKYRKNQIVRIVNQKKRKQFAQKMSENWSREKFRIIKVISRNVPMYVLRHTKNTIDTFGCFYEHEIEKA